MMDEALLLVVWWDKHVLEQVLEQTDREVTFPYHLITVFFPHQISLIRLMVFDRMEKYHTSHMLLIILY